MTPREAAAILRQHNEYRRDQSDDPPPMQSPTLIGIAIDVAVKFIEETDHE